jgi:hypothetical protein
LDEEESSHGSTAERLRHKSRRRSVDAEHLLQTLCRNVAVVDFDQVITKAGYVRIEADVHIPAAAAAPSAGDDGRDRASSAKKDAKRRRTAATPKQSSVGKASKPSSKRASPPAAPGGAGLRFCYERTGEKDPALRGMATLDHRTGEDGDGPRAPSASQCYVSYTIDYCAIAAGEHSEESGTNQWGTGPLQRLLWVNVFAPSGAPSPAGAKMLGEDDDDDELWSDVEDDEIEMEQGKKGKQDGGDDSDADDVALDAPTNATLSKGRKGDETRPAGSDDRNLGTAEDEAPDLFAAGIDPDVLERLLVATGLNADPSSLSSSSRPIVDDATALFFLMSFPFYEQEWDLVGFVLDAAFGSDADSDDGREDGCGGQRR